MEGNGILSKEECEKIMEKYTISKNFTIKHFSVNLLKTQLDGLIGEQYIVRVHYNTGGTENIAQFFLKTLNGSNRLMFELAKSIYAYEKESFYYEDFVPLLELKGLESNYVPKSYLCQPYIIVLEDLSLLSYKGTPKNKPLDLLHCKKCLETLAKFHIGPILYEIKKTKEIGKHYSLNDEFKNILEDKIFSEEENGATKFMRCSLKGLFQLIELIPRNGINKNDFIDKLQQALNNIMSSQGDSMGFRSTLLHGDLWGNNFLYQYENESSEITDCKLIDFQTLKYGPPALDVLQFILTNTRKSFRDEHHYELLTYYYNYFSNLLANRGYQASEVLSESEFKKSCDVFTLPAKIQAVVDRCITFMPDETFIEAAHSEESFSKFLFEERGKYIVTSFNEDQYFRDLMIEDVNELRDFLFQE